MRFSKTKNKKIAAVLLVLALIMNCLFLSASADEGRLYEGNTLNGWSVSAFWTYSGENYSVTLENNNTVSVELTVSFYAPVTALPHSYPKGTVKFSIPDFGTVKRTGRFVAQTAASTDGAQWSVEYDLENSRYIFSNELPLAAREAVSGGFTMKWNLNGYSCQNEFRMTESPEFSLYDPDRNCFDTTVMTPLSFSVDTVRDFYSISLSRNELGYESFIIDDINKADYVTYDYRTNFARNARARYSDFNTYFVKVSVQNSDTDPTPLSDEKMSRIIVQTFDGGVREEHFLSRIEDPFTGESVWGFYRFVDKESAALPQDSFYLSFPMSMLSNLARVESFLMTHYLDEPDEIVYDFTNTASPEVLSASREDMISQYHYIYGNGNFSMGKTSPYEAYSGDMATSDAGLKPASTSMMLLAKRVFENGRVTFDIHGRYRMTPTTGSSSSGRKTALLSTSSSEGTRNDGDVDPEAQGIDLDTSFDMVLGDDRLSVVEEDGHTRFLTADEYDLSTILIPKQKPYLDYDVYVSSVGYTPPSAEQAASGDPGTIAAPGDYHLYLSGNTSSQRIVDLTNASATLCPNGVKAMYIRFKGFTGNYLVNYQLTITFHLDTSLPIKRSDGGNVANNGFMRIFKHGQNNNILKIYRDSFSPDSFNNEVMKLDIKTYNDFPEGEQPDYSSPDGYELLYHALSCVYLRDFQTVLTSNTTADSRRRSHEEGEGYEIGLTSSGSIIADKLTSDNPEEAIPPSELTEFSLCLRLDKLLTIDPRLANVSLVDCSATDIFGEPVDNSAFEQRVTYRLITLSDGKRVIAAEFDFSDMPLDMSERTFIKMKVPAEILYTDFKLSPVKGFTVNSYTALTGESVGKIVTQPDYSATTIDWTGTDTGRIMATSSASRSYETVVESWIDKGEKFVKSYEDESWQYYSEGTSWISETSVHANDPAFIGEAAERATYQYRIGFDMGLPTSDIIFYDRLETADGTEWHGKLRSIDLTFARSLGLVPTVYYSSDEELEYTESASLVDGELVVENNLSFYTASPVTSDIWTAPTDDIRSVCVAFDTSGIGVSGTIKSKPLYFIMNMLAPESSTHEDKYDTYAINLHGVSYTSHTSVENRRVSLISSPARVMLLPPVLFVTMLKKDSDSDKPLPEAEYTFYTSPDADEEHLVRDHRGNIIAQAVPSDRFGEIRIETLPPGEYWYKETRAPAGYQLDDTVYHIVLDIQDRSYILDNSSGYDESLVRTDYKLSGKILFRKRDGDITDKDVYIKGAQYALYASDDTRLFTDDNNVYQPSGGTKSVFTTDANGEIIITGLPWGNYYLKELEPPAGYEINDAKVWVNISRYVNVAQQEEENAILVTPVQDDEELTASIRLTKFDRDGITPLPNAWFSLKKLRGDDPDAEDAWQTVPGYEYLKTARNGTIDAEGLKFGTYCFEEVISPTGYVLDETDLRSDSVVLDASTVGTMLRVSKTNERILGSAKLHKVSDDGIPLNGTRFDLYMVLGDNDYSEERAPDDPDDLLYRAGLITKNIGIEQGVTETVTDLDWGSYYFREVSSVSGYIRDDTVYSFEINAANADVTVDKSSENVRKRGEVVLNKTAARAAGGYHSGDPIEGAVFSLYTDADIRLYVRYEDGKYTVCGSEEEGATDSMTTGADGRIDVQGLEWGGYYFEETMAPEGFSLSDRVRFSVNRTSCLAVQELECEDLPVTCLIRIDKEIDDKLEVFGTPVFIFRIREINTGREYKRMITLAGDSKKGSTALQVDPGTYTVEEITVGRYRLSETEYVLSEDGEEKTTVPAEERFIDDERTDSKSGGSVFRFTLSSRNDKPDKAEVRFINTLENYSGVSHTASRVNTVPTKRRLTGFSITYDGDIPCADTEFNPGGFTLEPEKLHYYLSYDDGATEEMTPEEIALVTPSVFTADNGYANAGQSIPFTAQFVREGRTYRTSFFVNILPYKITETQKVIYRSDADNYCYFPVGTKKAGANLVYYNDDENGDKTAVMGEYIAPVMLANDRVHKYWQIVGGEYDGTRIAAKESAVTEFLKEHYDEGLRELELRAVLGSFVFDFEATGEVQVFEAPADGIYRLEGWGAQGGGSMRTDYLTRPDLDRYYETEGGRGGYSYGYVYLRQGQQVYVAVGGKGETVVNNCEREHANESIDGGWNGGGAAGNADGQGYCYNGSGGGATHFAINNDLGELKNYSGSQNDVLLVAGGGGGSGFYQTPLLNNWYYMGYGGYGGGINAGSAHDVRCTGHGGALIAGGATETSPGTISNTRYGENGQFGQGGSRGLEGSCSGGGGGWYGGASSTDNGGGGGSGHCNEEELSQGYPYATIGGDNEFRSPDGGMETGHGGDGFARVTLVGVPDMEEFDYTGSVQTFVANHSGRYEIELWGAEGGCETDADLGGNGGYTVGTIELTEGTRLFVYVGGKPEAKRTITGESNPGGWGGGGATYHAWSQSGTGGGGATDIRLTPSSAEDGWSGFDSLRTRIMVAGGGGGGSDGNWRYYYDTVNPRYGEYVDSSSTPPYSAGANYGYGVTHIGNSVDYTPTSGGAGGGINGGDGAQTGSYGASGASQTSGGTVRIDGSSDSKGKFGKGGGGRYIGNFGCNGGGGGYFGGGASSRQHGGGGGGSSYISGYEGCKAITQSSVENSISFSDDSVHYSGRVFTNAQIIDGSSLMPSKDGLSQVRGNTGNGFARITYIG